MTMLQHGMVGSAGGYQIPNSLRFRASASASLSRTPGAAGNRKLLAQRYRIKRGAQGSLQVIASAGTASIDRFYFDSSDRLVLDVLGTARLVTTPIQRDPTAWYVDVGFELDVANGTAALRAKILVNDVEVTAYSTDGRASITNTDTNWNNTVIHYIGRDNAGNYFDGYMAEPVQVDGSKVVAYSEVNTDGVRVPKAPSATYGTCGSFVKFNDATSLTTLGYDRSGNANNWTCTNISLTAGVTYDHMVDTPTNNYATLSPIFPSAANISYANLRSGTTAVRGTINANDGAGHYWEVTAAGSNVTAGVIDDTTNTNTTTVTANKVFGFRVTAAGNLDYINITDAGAWTSIATGLTGNRFPYGITAAADWNFGQRPWIGTASGSALCTANLPQVAITNPRLHFDIKTRTGTAASATINGYQFAPDFVWIKSRGRAVDHALFDSVRGVQKMLESNQLGAESTEATGLTAFNSDGYTIGALDQINGTTATNSFVDWAWKANGAGVTNTAGTITSTVSANTTAGFSIVTYTGTGANATVGHGLGVAPKMVIVKRRLTTDANGYWRVYHSSLTSAAYNLTMNTTNAEISSPTIWNSTAPTSTVFSIGTSQDVNWDGTKTYVAYCFAEIPGYSKFGKYTGNNNADGPFCYTGFLPRLVLIKAINSAGTPWIIYDTARDTYNVMGTELRPNSANSEANNAADSPGLIDVTATGFKVRDTGTGSYMNGNGNIHIFAAFAEMPTGGMNVAPAPAR